MANSILAFLSFKNRFKLGYQSWDVNGHGFPEDIPIDFVIAVRDYQARSLDITPRNIRCFVLQFIGNVASSFTNDLNGSVQSKPKLIIGINVIAGLSFCELTGKNCVVQHMLKASPVVFTALLHRWAVRGPIRLGENSD